MSETRKSAEAVFVPLRPFSPRCEGFALQIQTPHCGFKRQSKNSQCVLLHRRKETAKRRPFCARRGFKREGFDEASRDVAKQPQVPVGLSRFFADQGSQTEEKDQEAQSVSSWQHSWIQRNKKFSPLWQSLRGPTSLRRWKAGEASYSFDYLI